ncbi:MULTISPECIES: hypothetical protein [Mycobacterium]|uniref:hypothetical protein n=1 Tax=Mycobacterium TaxID=1763 RepID=UPI000B020EEA|nr:MULTISPECIES: hypothetical protein [Mycobacterium]MCV7034832.1 hypothetical protein [Mycobacterium heckeshornense]
MSTTTDQIVENWLDPGYERITETRAALLTELSTGLAALVRARNAVDQLRELYDIELVEGWGYDDAVAFINDSQRYARATYSIIHAIIDHETP